MNHLGWVGGWDVDGQRALTIRMLHTWGRIADTADGIELFSIGAVPATRNIYRGSKIPSPLDHG